MTYKLENYTFDEDENGDLVISHNTEGTIIRHDQSEDKLTPVKPFGDTHHDSVSTANVSNTEYLHEYPGDTLNAKWDNLRTELDQGPTRVVLNEPDDSDPAAEVLGSGSVAGIQCDAPLEIDDADNALILDFGKVGIFPTAAMDTIIDISTVDKTEDVTIFGGVFYAEGNADKAIRLHGGSRVRIYETLTTTRSSNFSYGIYADDDVSPLGTLTVDNASFDFVNTSSIYANNANSLTVRDCDGVGTDVFHFLGTTQNSHIENLTGDNSGPGVGNSVVRLSANADGRPYKSTIKNVRTSEAAIGVLAEDTTGGTANKMTELTIEDIGVFSNNAGSQQFDINWMENCRIDTVGTFGASDPSLGADTDSINVRDGYSRGAANYTDNGTNNTISDV